MDPSTEESPVVRMMTYTLVDARLAAYIERLESAAVVDERVWIALEEMHADATEWLSSIGVDTGIADRNRDIIKSCIEGKNDPRMDAP